jgi:hypothetical protein
MAHDGKMPYNSDTCEKFAMSFHFFYFRNVKSGRNKQSKWKRIAFEKKKNILGSDVFHPFLVMYLKTLQASFTHLKEMGLAC